MLLLHLYYTKLDTKIYTTNTMREVPVLWCVHLHPKQKYNIFCCHDEKEPMNRETYRKHSTALQPGKKTPLQPEIKSFK